jgi:hypothetical protein
MNLTASVTGLLTAMGMSVLASAATAEPLSAPALMQVAAKHHHVARHSQNSQTCDETDPKQVYDWSHWPNNPCWPCVSGSPGETSAYPSWEVRPNCQ